MDSSGQRAFPSIETLARETSLTSRAVGTHLEKAAKDGWIVRKKWRDKGKNWAQYAYSARLPDGIEGQEPRSLPTHVGQEPPVDGAESDGMGVQNVVRTNSTKNSTNNSIEPLAEAIDQQKSAAGKIAFRELVAKMTGRVRDNGRSEKAADN